MSERSNLVVVSENLGKLVMTVLLAILALVSALVLYFQVRSSWRSDYLLQSTAKRVDAGAERFALRRYNTSLPCEWLGEEVSVGGRPGLRYAISNEQAREEVACLQSGAPAGFKLVKEGFF